MRQHVKKIDREHILWRSCVQGKKSPGLQDPDVDNRHAFRTVQAANRENDKKRHGKGPLAKYRLKILKY